MRWWRQTLWKAAGFPSPLLTRTAASPRDSRTGNRRASAGERRGREAATRERRACAAPAGRARPGNTTAPAAALWRLAQVPHEGGDAGLAHRGVLLGVAAGGGDRADHL